MEEKSASAVVVAESMGEKSAAEAVSTRAQLAMVVSATGLSASAGWSVAASEAVGDKSAVAWVSG